MHPQSGLGKEHLHRKPVYDQLQIGRVTSTKDYNKYGRIEVIFLDYSQPFPVWVNGDLDREPVEGDQVLVGFIQGRPDAPYLAGFIRNKSYTANFIKIEKGRIILQMPTDTKDIQGALMDESKKDSRAYVEIKGSEVIVHAPSIKLADGTTEVARKGDSVSVNVPGVGTCTGTITSGTSKVKA